jgi:hypothetical protein
MKNQLRWPCAKTCQNNSIKEYQGIYQFIKDCTGLYEIANWGKAPRVMNGSVTEPDSMNPPQTRARPDDWKSNRYRNRAVPSANKCRTHITCTYPLIGCS